MGTHLIVHGFTFSEILKISSKVKSKFVYRKLDKYDTLITETGQHSSYQLNELEGMCWDWTLISRMHDTVFSVYHGLLWPTEIHAESKHKGGTLLPQEALLKKL